MRNYLISGLGIESWNFHSRGDAGLCVGEVEAHREGSDDITNGVGTLGTAEDELEVKVVVGSHLVHQHNRSARKAKD